MTLTLYYPFDPDLFPPITQNFTEHIRRAQINKWTNYNGGIDWALLMGTIITAAHDGTVLSIANDATGYGKHIRIKDETGEYITIYAHLQIISVAAGQKVKAGQPIGVSGTSGYSTGPHLHFELRKKNKAIDPSPYLVATEPEPTMIPTLLPGMKITIMPLYNLRSGPGISFQSYTILINDVPATIEEQRDDWVKVTITCFVNTRGIKPL